MGGVSNTDLETIQKRVQLKVRIDQSENPPLVSIIMLNH